jgi:hypothetical protein
VVGTDGRPLADVRVRLTSSDQLFSVTATTGREGDFGISGIPEGEHALLFERDDYRKLEEKDLFVEPCRLLYVRVTLARADDSRKPASEPIWTDLTDVSSSTVISRRQVHSLPSAGNLWSVIENQDLSATTSRIDVGGIWADRPALWSSRGSVSWTQSRYLINGMDVTDPFYGGMPLFHPDLDSLDFIHHSNGRHPVEYISPGGHINLIPGEGTPKFHASLSASFTNREMTGSNITPALEAEGLSETHRLNSFQDYRARFSGPLLPGRLLVQVSVGRLAINRDVAEFSGDDQGTVSSGLVNLTWLLGQSSLQFFWTGQLVKNPTSGADRLVPLSATLDRENRFHIAQLIWRGRIRADHSFQLGASYSRGDYVSRFQDGADRPHALELLQGTPAGAAAMAGRDERRVLALTGRAEALFSFYSGHRLEYGFSLRHASASAQREILDNIHLRFFGGCPYEIIRFNSPGRDRERSLDLELYAQDTVSFGNLATLSVGFHLISTRGWLPDSSADGSTPATAAITLPPEAGGKIRWLHLAPRLSLALPFLRDKSLTMRLSAARYYGQLPLYLLAYGHPASLGGQAYPWTDSNHDGSFQEGEAGPLWRREGPLFSRIDPGLKRPYTDEYAISVTKIFGRGLFFTLAGFYRETRDLIETLNTGVPLNDYLPVQVYDPGDDTVPGTHDDLYLVVYNQQRETLGKDFFLLTNPDSGRRVSRYRGLDLTLVKKFDRRGIFFFSFTATEAIGTTSPGNTEWENDDGIVGALYDNPNAFLFAKGRMRFDRAYTARLGLSFAVPLGFRLAGLAKYYDGQPFTRKIIVGGLNQGPFYIQSFPRGVARYEFNMTVDLRLEKEIGLGQAKGRIFLDGYNIFNWAMATEENEWTGPEFPLRYATEVQPPRVFRIGISYEF